jgi:hypothetical protein
MIAYAETGQGALIMINANDDSQAVGKIMNAIKRVSLAGRPLRNDPPHRGVAVNDWGPLALVMNLSFQKPAEPFSVVVNGLNTVTNLISGTRRFYRLHALPKF